MSDISSFTINPWLKLPKSSPYILPEDLKRISKYKITPENLGWQLEFLPVPYLGNFKKAQIVLLCLNPGYDKILDQLAHKDKSYYQENLRSLNFASKIPFYCLNPGFDYSGGYKWWVRLLKQLIEKYSLKLLSEKLMCLQYLPYHSKTFKNPPCLLPSQNYTFCLLKKAIKEQKVIVIMRSKKLWFSTVPELKTYDFIELKNYRMPYLTRGNIKNGNFEKIIRALET